MRVSVEFEGVNRTQGTMSIVPSWLGRLFGRRARAARIKFVTYLGWRYDVDDAEIGADLEKIVNQQRRWQEIRGVPPARVVSHRSDR